MIEVFFDSKRDSIGMEVTCKSGVLSQEQAQELALEWRNEVLNVFRSHHHVTNGGASRPFVLVQLDHGLWDIGAGPKCAPRGIKCAAITDTLLHTSPVPLAAPRLDQYPTFFLIPTTFSSNMILELASDNPLHTLIRLPNSDSVIYRITSVQNLNHLGELQGWTTTLSVTGPASSSASKSKARRDVATIVWDHDGETVTMTDSGNTIASHLVFDFQERSQ
ncbi:hypothetical protein AG1IA_02112 [Rhizoctonia solani AG-1 IA]|uniref:Uncharacterized protein n=1 Tax=Thanatephorus cucumeris (strain AG1-IA) TaxID=983506 RepID=L8X0W4_THACA|nr:hypothetical protein AG1IA_02112 [Rhizoctonia solani AG-1 IA]